MDRETELIEIIGRYREELDSIRDEQLREKSEDIVGKYFKYDNGYSETERWDMYTHAYSFDDGNVICLKFQTKSFEVIEIEMADRMHVNSFTSGYVEITETEFKTAWSMLINKLMTFRDEEPPF